MNRLNLSKFQKRVFFITALFLWHIPIFAKMGCDSSFKPFAADYQLLHNNKKTGTAQASLEMTEQGHWRYRFNSKAKVALLFKADIRESSEFRLNENNQFEALSYQFEQKIGPKKKIVSALFKPNQGNSELSNAQGNNDGKAWNIYLQGGETDRLLVNLQIGELLKQGKTEFSFDSLEKGRVRQLKFRAGEIQTVETPLGSFAAFIVERLHDNPKRKTSLWYAPELGYIPIKILREKKGKKPVMLLLQNLSCDTRAE